MPAKVQKGFSVTILTTIFTTLILALVGWTGTGTLKAYSTEIDVGYVKGQMETMNQTLVEILAISHQRNVSLAKYDLRIKFCEDNIKLCRSAK